MNYWQFWHFYVLFGNDFVFFSIFLFLFWKWLVLIRENTQSDKNPKLQLLCE